jgi:ferredoxin
MFLVFCLFLLVRTRFPFQAFPPPDAFLQVSPLLAVFYFLKTRAVAWFLWPSLLTIALAVVFGRFFCGWICPLGTSLDLFFRVFGPIAPESTKSPEWGRSLRIFLAVVLGATGIVGLNLWGFFDPLSIFVRGYTVVVHPVCAYAYETIWAGVSLVPGVNDFGRSWYLSGRKLLFPEGIPNTVEVIPMVMGFLLIFGLEFKSRRFWCRFVCPAGTVLGCAASLGGWGRTASSACVQCRQCAKDCKMGAIAAENPGTTWKMDCVQCLSCISMCPVKTVEPASMEAPRTGERIRGNVWRFGWSRPAPEIPERRQLLLVAGSGLFYGVLQRRDLKNKALMVPEVIRPPAAISESEFLNRCIRCLACVRMCQSNGGCLQPASLLHGVGAWAPIADMRRGYCEYNCNLCTRVCPTNAIRPFSLQAKQKFPMGTAVFNKNLCIPYQRHTDCLVCEEHCPLPDKAIKFHLKEVELPSGKKKMIKFPYIDRELCIGCGICEHKCPLQGERGVYVTVEKRPAGTTPKGGH